MLPKLSSLSSSKSGRGEPPSWRNNNSVNNQNQNHSLSTFGPGGNAVSTSQSLHIQNSLSMSGSESNSNNISASLSGASGAGTMVGPPPLSARNAPQIGSDQHPDSALSVNERGGPGQGLGVGVIDQRLPLTARNYKGNSTTNSNSNSQSASSTGNQNSQKTQNQNNQSNTQYCNGSQGGGNGGKVPRPPDRPADPNKISKRHSLPPNTNNINSTNIAHGLHLGIAVNEGPTQSYSQSREGEISESDNHNRGLGGPPGSGPGSASGQQQVQQSEESMTNQQYVIKTSHGVAGGGVTRSTDVSSISRVPGTQTQQQSQTQQSNSQSTQNQQQQSTLTLNHNSAQQQTQQSSKNSSQGNNSGQTQQGSNHDIKSIKSTRTSQGTGSTNSGRKRGSVHKSSQVTEVTLIPKTAQKVGKILGKETRQYLTEFEQSEILGANEIYYYGANAKGHKIKGHAAVTNKNADGNTGLKEAGGNAKDTDGNDNTVTATSEIGASNSTKQQTSPFHNHGYDDEKGDYNLILRDHINYRFEVVEGLGKGSFGQVVRAIDHKYNAVKGTVVPGTVKTVIENSENNNNNNSDSQPSLPGSPHQVALKIIRNKKRFHQQALIEIRLLQYLRDHDTDNTANIVHVTDHFYFRNHLCITFELLSMNLYDFIRNNNFRGVSLGLIRRFGIQLLASLRFLKSLSIIHCDLKPENVVLKDPTKSGIKLIDFGSSCFTNERIYSYIQSRFYRSPEIILGMQYSCAIDMWSFACILAELYSGHPLFGGENEQEQIQCILEVLDMPPQSLLQQSTRRRNYFDSHGNARCVPNSRGKKRRVGTKDLKSAIRCHDEEFIDFLSKCLTWDQNDRFTPEQAMYHPWILDGKKPEAVLGIHHQKIQESLTVEKNSTISGGSVTATGIQQNESQYKNANIGTVSGSIGTANQSHTSSKIAGTAKSNKISSILDINPDEHVYQNQQYQSLKKTHSGSEANTQVSKVTVATTATLGGNSSANVTSVTGGSGSGSQQKTYSNTNYNSQTSQSQSDNQTQNHLNQKNLRSYSNNKNCNNSSQSRHSNHSHSSDNGPGQNQSTPYGNKTKQNSITPQSAASGRNGNYHVNKTVTDGTQTGSNVKNKGTGYNNITESFEIQSINNPLNSTQAMSNLSSKNPTISMTLAGTLNYQQKQQQEFESKLNNFQNPQPPVNVPSSSGVTAAPNNLRKIKPLTQAAIAMQNNQSQQQQSQSQTQSDSTVANSSSFEFGPSYNQQKFQILSQSLGQQYSQRNSTNNGPAGKRNNSIMAGSVGLGNINGQVQPGNAISFDGQSGLGPLAFSSSDPFGASDVLGNLMKRQQQGQNNQTSTLSSSQQQQPTQTNLNNNQNNGIVSASNGISANLAATISQAFSYRGPLSQGKTQNIQNQNQNQNSLKEKTNSNKTTSSSILQSNTNYNSNLASIIASDSGIGPGQGASDTSENQNGPSVPNHTGVISSSSHNSNTSAISNMSNYLRKTQGLGANQQSTTSANLSNLHNNVIPGSLKADFLSGLTSAYGSHNNSYTSGPNTSANLGNSNQAHGNSMINHIKSAGASQPTSSLISMSGAPQSANHNSSQIGRTYGVNIQGSSINIPSKSSSLTSASHNNSGKNYDDITGPGPSRSGSGSQGPSNQHANKLKQLLDQISPIDYSKGEGNGGHTTGVTSSNSYGGGGPSTGSNHLSGLSLSFLNPTNSNNVRKHIGPLRKKK